MALSNENRNNLIGVGIKALGTIFTGVAERIRARRLAREEKDAGSACKKCGTILPNDVRFCWGCGTEREAEK